jgi:hypothetical protein
LPTAVGAGVAVGAGRKTAPRTDMTKPAKRVTVDEIRMVGIIAVEEEGVKGRGIIADRGLWIESAT